MTPLRFERLEEARGRIQFQALIGRDGTESDIMMELNRYFSCLLRSVGVSLEIR